MHKVDAFVCITLEECEQVRIGAGDATRINGAKYLSHENAWLVRLPITAAEDT